MHSLSTFSLPLAPATRALIAVPVPASFSHNNAVTPAAPARQQHTPRQLAAENAHRAQALARRRAVIPSSAKRF